MTAGRIADHLTAVRDRIDLACDRAGRDPAKVRLMPVSKTHPPALLREAYAAGARLLGENRVQEAYEKAQQLADLPDLGWAMIGHLQTNKARQVAEFAAEFHALDSLKLAAALDRRLGELDRTLDVFIQVNSSAEPQKFGLAPAEVERFARDLQPMGALRVRGLMTLAVYSDDPRPVGACFDRMRALQRQLRESGAPGSFDELSMGMSGDFELAVAYGATTVRVGQAIFGTRQTG